MNGSFNPYQEKAIEFALKNKKCCLFMATGSGKTLVSLAYLKVLDKPAVVIMPANIRDKRVWSEEAAKFGIDPGLTESILSSGKVLIVSYDWVKYNLEILDDYDVVVMEEGHAISNVDTVRYKQLQEIMRKKERVVVLAGYPVENKLTEIYGQVSMVSDVLGDNYYHFLYRYFTVVKKTVKGKNRIVKAIPKKGAMERIIDQMKDIAFCVPKEEVMPEGVNKEVYVARYELSWFQTRMLSRLYADYEFHEGDIHVTCKGNLAVHSKAMQIVSGFVYNDGQCDSNGKRSRGDPQYLIENPKFDKMQEILEGRSNYLLWYLFDAEYLIVKEFEKYGSLYKVQSECRGLNMQDYGFAMYYSVPLSGGNFMQSQDRIYRQGRETSVPIVTLLPEGEFGDRLFDMMRGKATLTKRFMDGLKKAVDKDGAYSSRKRKTVDKIFDPFSLKK